MSVVAAGGAGAGPLKQAVELIEKGEGARALGLLGAGGGPIADYVGYWRAQALEQAKRYGEVGAALEPVWRTTPESPLKGRAAMVGLRAMVEMKDWRGALALVGRVGYEKLPQPAGGLAMAKALEGAGDGVGAAARYQQVYFGAPLSGEAREAGGALLRLEGELGERYPPVLGQERLKRARLLMEGGKSGEAREELVEASPRMAGLEREQARVRVGEAWYRQRKVEAAIEWLRGLELSEPEADAERLYWIVAAARRGEDEAAMRAALGELERKARRSEWRLKALLVAATLYVVVNDAAGYVPLYKACAEGFPASDEAAGCDWKVAWRAYLDRSGEAGARMRAHVERYPESDKAGAALYYLGRLAENGGAMADAKRYFSEITVRFPHYYYAVLARERLGRAELKAAAGQGVEAERVLSGVRWPERVRRADFVVDAETRRRLERGRALAGEGLEIWAEIELRYGARNGGKKYPLVVELAEAAVRRGAPDVALRYVKGTVPEFLWLDRDGAPARFWRLAFPMPYRGQIVKHARAQGLDVNLVAALIRQESEFDRGAVSPSNAIGLMQVMPATGRELGRRLGIRGVRVATLKNAEVNLKLGTYYLKRQLEAREGSVEETLAGYNAGPSRIPVWKRWADFGEPAEFVETIPFQQTRDYVQIIVRNRDAYKWIWAGEPEPAVEAAVVKPAAKRAVKKAPAGKRRKSVRKKR